MAKRYDFKSVVSDRSRRIARDAQARVTRQQERTRPDGAESSRGWIRRAVGYLPDSLKNKVRTALGPDPRHGELDRLIEKTKRNLDDIRVRESVIEAARRELVNREVLADEREFELRSRQVKLDNLLAKAEQAANATRQEQRVPLDKILFEQKDAPRPVRDVNRLAANIRRFGQLTPIVVRPGPGQRFVLLTGYRRMAALKVANATHVLIRVIDEIDEATAAALYIAENCLVTGQSSNAVKHLSSTLSIDHPMHAVLQRVMDDDDAVVEDVYLDEMSEQANHALAEGAAWVSALRPYWADLSADERLPLEQLIMYFAKVAKRLK
ncbi:MAG: ParB/RepB/Spo0J family partition protein [Myxococcota bacterium]|nr:ParB/RepB/Spo0J family partition protein [Myxococcota bacterium]